MKFKGQPNLYVRIANKQMHRLTNIKGISFDSNGIYETDNPILIKALSVHFETIKSENTVKDIQETTNGEEIKEMKKCKKCDFVADNQGELLAHYRKQHKKE